MIIAARVLRGAWAIFWLFIGGVFVITGVALTVGLLLGKPDVGVSGPIFVILGLWIGGYFRLWQAFRDQERKP